ncbi:MAG: ribulose-phosphate 3-epimerase [Ignavibacteriaceae bacterium]|nr:ribulose-phosphate 3-epimerase [Ignavibacteriaceae bacterium]
MGILAPSILSADFSNLSQQIRLTEMAGADWIHCDVMDGQFVPNLTFGPVVVEAARKVTRLPIDVHLMIKNPDNLIEEFFKAGADFISVHFEEVVHLNRTVKRIKDFGIKAGVAINPSTPVSSLENIAEYIDLLLIMTVNPGFGGQSFISNSFKKITEAAELRKKLNANFLIEVDGGINKETISRVRDAGCDVFVAGSAIFHSENIPAETAALKNLIK